MRKLGALISVPIHVANKLKHCSKKEMLHQILYDDTFASEVRDFIEVQTPKVVETLTILDDDKEVSKFISIFTENIIEQTRVQEFVQRSMARNCLLIYYS